MLVKAGLFHFRKRPCLLLLRYSLGVKKCSRPANYTSKGCPFGHPLLVYAEGGTRTPTQSPAVDFESTASTIPPLRLKLFNNYKVIKRIANLFITYTTYIVNYISYNIIKMCLQLTLGIKKAPRLYPQSYFHVCTNVQQLRVSF